MVSIKLKSPPTRLQLDWIYKNVGPGRYYLHNQIGGEGWRFKRKSTGFLCDHYPNDVLEFDDDRMATLWLLKWGQ